MPELAREARGRGEERSQAPRRLEDLGDDDAAVRDVDDLARPRAEVAEANSSIPRKADGHLGAVAVPRRQRRRQRGKHLRAAKAGVTGHRRAQDLALLSELVRVVPLEIRAGPALARVRTRDPRRRRECPRLGEPPHQRNSFQKNRSVMGPSLSPERSRHKPFPATHPAERTSARAVSRDSSVSARAPAGKREFSAAIKGADDSRRTLRGYCLQENGLTLASG